MTPQELRDSILNSAFIGRFTQDSFLAADDTADSFFHLLLSKKELLIKEKVIHREKNPISSEDAPFAIPDTWLWVRTGDCVSNRTGLSYDKANLSKKSESMVRVLRGGNISDMKYHFYDNDVMISSEYVDPSLVLIENDIITPAVTSLEKIAKMARIEKNYTDVVAGGFVLVLRPLLSNYIFSKYLLYLFSSPYFRQECRKNTKKSGQAFYNLSREKMMNIMIPLPPASEQKRIVEKIESLMPLVDEYERLWCEIHSRSSHLADSLKQSILFSAFEGRLTNNINSHDYVSALKKRRATFGKKQKVKAPQTQPSTDVEIVCPDEWDVVLLSEITEFIVDGSHNPPPPAKSGIPLLSAKNVHDGKLTIGDNERMISEEDYERDFKKHHPIKGDVLLTIIGASIGRSAVISEDKPIAFQRSVAFMRPMIDPYFLSLWLETPQVYKQLMAEKSGTAQPGVYLGSLEKIRITLPCLEEQRAIVEKVSKLFGLIDNDLAGFLSRNE